MFQAWALRLKGYLRPGYSGNCTFRPGLKPAQPSPDLQFCFEHVLLLYETICVCVCDNIYIYICV